MKKLNFNYLTSFLLLLTLHLFNSSIFAQNHTKPPMKPDENHIQNMVDELVEEISLSKDQQNEVVKLFYDHFKNIRAKQNENRERMEKDRKNFENKIMNLLTNDQKEKYLEFLENHKPPKHNRPKH